MVHSSEAFDEDAKIDYSRVQPIHRTEGSKYGGGIPEPIKAGLAQHSAQVELGLGQFVELSFTAKITGIKYDICKPELVLYRVEIRTKDGYYINSCDVDVSMIVRG